MNWLDFVSTGKAAAKVRALNSSGGINKGREYCAWERVGSYFRIWNQAGNAVRCSADNFEIVSDADNVLASAQQ